MLDLSNAPESSDYRVSQLNTCQNPSVLAMSLPTATDNSLSRVGRSQSYKSGNPQLAAVDEAERAPTFDDPYEECRYLKHRLALAFRIFAKFDLSEGVAGHITLRDPVDPTSFWVNPFGEIGVIRAFPNE